MPCHSVLPEFRHLPPRAALAAAGEFFAGENPQIFHFTSDMMEEAASPIEPTAEHNQHARNALGKPGVADVTHPGAETDVLHTASTDWVYPRADGAALIALLVEVGAEFLLLRQSRAKLVIAAVERQISQSQQFLVAVEAVDASVTADYSVLLEQYPSLQQVDWGSHHRRLIERRIEADEGLQSKYAEIAEAIEALKEPFTSSPGQHVDVDAFQNVQVRIADGLRSYLVHLGALEQRFKTLVYNRMSRLNFYRLIPLSVALVCLFGLLIESILVLLPIMRILKNAHELESLTLPEAPVGKPRETAPAPVTSDGSEHVLLKARFLSHLEDSIRQSALAIVEKSRKLAETEVTADQSAHVETLRTAGEALVATVTNILDFAKIESGHLAPKLSNFDLRNVVEETLEWLSPKAHDKDLDLTLSMDETVPTLLRGDTEQLRQILTNLLSNGIEHTDRGDVTLRIEVTERTNDAARFRVSVTDTGTGMSAEQIDGLFEIDSSAESDDVPVEEITGIGLKTCKRLAELLGGEIGVQSELGKGSTVWITAWLTVHSDEPALSLEIEGLPQGSRVLIVDDSPVVREVLANSVATMGLETETAQSGEHAVGLLEKRCKKGQLPEIVIVDSDMPGLSGTDVARSIKSSMALSRCLVVLMTREEINASEKESNAAISAFLKKPVRLSRLRDCISSLAKSIDLRKPPRRDRQAGDGKGRGGQHAKPLFHALLAEHNPVLQKITQRMLEKLKCRVDVVGTGRDVLESIRNTEYDLVLINGMMPGISGPEATVAIRQTEAGTGKRLPVIGMTNPAEGIDPGKCLEAGMDACIAKPVKSRDLVRLLKKLNSLKQGRKIQDTRVLVAASRQPSPMPPKAPLDEGALVTLMKLGGNDNLEILLNTIDRFICDVTVDLDDFRAACSIGDVTAVEKTAADLNSKCSVLGAVSLARISLEIVDAARQGSLDESRKSIDQLELEFNNVRRTLARKLAELSSGAAQPVAQS